MKTLSEVDKIKKSLINHYYPELKNVKIIINQKKGKGFYMQTYTFPYFLIFFFGYKIEIHKSSLKLNDEAIQGCLAHELEHISFQHTRRKGLFDVPKQNEREIDALVIDRGLGLELLSFVKHHNSKYKKYKKKDGLTENEIKKMLNIQKP